MIETNLSEYVFDRNLVLCWPTWTGKTYAAMQLLEKFLSEVQSCGVVDFDWYFVSDWIFRHMVKSNQIRMRSAIEDAGRKRTDFPMEIMCRTKLLVYDDVWVSTQSDAHINDLTTILSERIRRKLPTIFTTNLSKKDMYTKIDERIVSRALWWADIILFSWQDRRLEWTRVLQYKQ